MATIDAPTTMGKQSLKRTASTSLFGDQPRTKQHRAESSDDDEEDLERLQMEIKAIQTRLKLKAWWKTKRSAASKEDVPRESFSQPGLRRTPNPSASFLGLPRELRDRIYALVIPRRNIHISHQSDSYESGSSTVGTEFIKGKGLTRKSCNAVEDDHVQGTNFMGGNRGYIGGFECRHSDCLYPRRSSSDHVGQPTWPFALAFVCRQTHGELCVSLYDETSFSFFSWSALRAFATKVPPRYIAHISEIRLGLNMGSGGDDLCHHKPEVAVPIARGFTGLRKIHVSLDLRFYDVRHLRPCTTTDWKLAHWARGVLNFACHPLEEATIFIENQDIIRNTTLSMLSNHDVSQDDLQQWARRIRDQLLAPWDRAAAVSFLQKHQKAEQKYHNKVCGSHWDFKNLRAPEQRVP
ncbi:hypothetical protein LTR85_006171 [Meristemomyces frigidus]|nr:hypothetical protein LTR85_006171 [Meristemomyces frigidus]